MPTPVIFEFLDLISFFGEKAVLVLKSHGYIELQKSLFGDKKWHLKKETPPFSLDKVELS